MPNSPDPARAPTILGPHGEGYCRTCRFIEPLAENGLLESHTRGASMGRYGGATVCEGSGRPPAKVTPYSSRLSAFRLKGEKTDCPWCGRNVVLAPDGRIPRHAPNFQQAFSICQGYYRYPHEYAG